MSETGSSRLQSQAENIREDVSHAAEQAKGTMSEMGERAKQTAREYGQKMKDYGQQGYEYAAEKSRLAKESTESYIRTNPWYAVGIALGAGLLLGMLMRGSRRED